MSQRRPLDVIQVPTPCPANWDEMSGDSTRRFCTGCRKFVHNLSAMSSDEAERLVCQSAGTLCVRFARDPESGVTITLDYAPVKTPSRRRAITTIVSLLGAFGFAGTWVAAKLLSTPAPPPMVAGMMVMPTPPSPQVVPPSE